MQLLNSASRHYSWGSRTMIPELIGEPKADRPLAELWYGAHPAAPSTVGEEPLNALIDAAPDTQLGQRVQADFGDRLPFLMKLLAAEEPLSLQAHPSKAQAEEGFARENEQGIDLSASNRNYKDDNHKPELIVALTEFYAMAGFRPLAQTRELFDALDCPDLARYQAMLVEGEDAESDNLRTLFTTWITIPSANRKQLINAIVDAAQKLLENLPADDWKAQVLGTIIDLDERYPDDVGVLGALLLNHIVLQPGEALFLAAGKLHAYVHGMGVEIMANSDNVLRGGLTPKFVDVPELVKVLDYVAIKDPRIHTQTGTSARVENGTCRAYPVPVDDFRLDCLELEANGTAAVAHDGPLVLLNTAGETELTSGENTETLRPGQAVWVPASDGEVTVNATAKSQLFIARA
ncbi:mannose-6-phosphate isomerase, class I [Corynebacterium camporealensis]